jgi:hypothetical protein
LTPLAWAGAALVGLALGLLGSGGSILTVPILVFLVGLEEKTAITTSLVIVGAVAAAGAILAAARRRVAWRSVLLFGLPGMAGTAAGAAIARHVAGAVQLGVFALFMLAAAGSMLRRRPEAESAPPLRGRAGWKLGIEGFGVGAVTGFVGIGGGFLIVPALVLLGGLPMSVAVGTSLWIIALNAFTGFARSLGPLAALGLAVDGRLVGLFSGVGAAASVIGNQIGARLPQALLRRAFGVALVALGLFVLARSLARLGG